MKIHCCTDCVSIECTYSAFNGIFLTNFQHIGAHTVIPLCVDYKWRNRHRKKKKNGSANCVSTLHRFSFDLAYDFHFIRTSFNEVTTKFLIEYEKCDPGESEKFWPIPVNTATIPPSQINSFLFNDRTLYLHVSNPVQFDWHCAGWLYSTTTMMNIKYYE